MARILDSGAILATLLLLTCSGCARRASLGEVPNSAGYTTNPDYNPNSPSLLQGLSDASINDWNFKSKF